MKEALYYKSLPDGMVQCQLCPHNCRIAKGGRGICGVRKNEDGILWSLNYGKAVSYGVDPIEKKPFFHFHPGAKTFSFCTVGCNFKCLFCQNWQISQARPEDTPGESMSPERIVNMAQLAGSDIISYTYTEPTIFFEYALDTSILAKKKGLLNTFHTNGFIEEKPFRQISKYLDAVNMDFKMTNAADYKKYCGADAFETVKQTALLCKELKLHLELTTLVVPGVNDNLKELEEIVRFIAYEVDKKTPLHFSRFYPHYKMIDTPQTDVKFLEQARSMARGFLRYVYIGNIPGHEAESTYCHNCSHLLIKRHGFSILEYNLDRGKCPECRKKLYMVGEYKG